MMRYMIALADRVSRGLERAGFAADPHGATASQPMFARSIAGWRRVLREAIERPTEDKGLIVLSLFLDGRVVDRTGDLGDLLEALRSLEHRRSLRRLMLELALAHRPPTGFFRDFVVEDTGEHRGHLDLKRGGLLPVAAIARYASFAAGARANSTQERLRVASTAGLLDRGDARTLAEAYELFWRLRLEHQVEQLRRGVEPDDYLDPETVNQLTRRYLRDAFHAVRAAAADALPTGCGSRDRAVRFGAARPRRRPIAGRSCRRASTPWKRARFVAVDLELTGLDPRRDEIISIAAVPVEHGRVVVGASRSLLVQPRRMPEAETIRIHKLRPAELADAPPLSEVSDSILELLTGRIIVAHPAWVEREFLAVALREARVRLREPVICTATLARSVLGETAAEPGHEIALAEAAARLGLPAEAPHTAGGDALTAAQHPADRSRPLGRGERLRSSSCAIRCVASRRCARPG